MAGFNIIKTGTYSSPLGSITIATLNDTLIGLWFKDQKYYLYNIPDTRVLDNSDKVIREVKLWLDDYFKGKNPSIDKLKLNPQGTSYQKKVWKILLDIPYGATTTYKDIAKTLEENETKRVCYQGIGSAVSHNPISIIIPCHRVIGTNGKLIGYAGGLEKKEYLLNLEKSEV